MNPTGSALTFLTYLGGSENDALLAIALDAGGNIVVTGGTTSSNFPTVNALQAAHGGSDDAVVAKINSSGTALLWSTYLGGSGSDFAYDLALGKNGQIFLTGITKQVGINFAA